MKENALIRKIEERDKGNYLNLFQQESFGCTGINSNMKPSLWEEEEFITRVINQQELAVNILIVEDNQEFIGYATITRENEKSYHIGEFVISKEKRMQGYGNYLIETIKDYANQDGCNILLECFSNAQNFFVSHQIEQNGIHFEYEGKKHQKGRNYSPIYMDYKIIEEERKKQEQEAQEQYKRFLKSPLCKSIFDML